MIAHFDVEDTKVGAREDQMVALVISIEEVIVSLKGSGFTSDFHFDLAIDHFPSNLIWFSRVLFFHMHYYVLVYLCFTGYHRMLF